MLGFLVKSAVGGVVAYTVLKVLEQNQVLEKVTVMGTQLLDELAQKLVPDGFGFGESAKPTAENFPPPSRPWSAS